VELRDREAGDVRPPDTQDASLDATLTARMATNTVVQAGGTLVSALLGLATFLALTRGLGPSSFGDYAAAAAYLSLPIVIADIGLTAGVLREISASPERTETAMRAFLPLSAAVGFTSVGLLVLVGLLVPFSEQTKVAIAIGGVGAFLTLITLALAVVLQARLQMHWFVAAGILGRVLTLGLMLGAFAVGFGFRAAVISTVVGIAATFVIVLFAVARQVSLRPVYDFAYWRRLGASSVLLGVAIGLGQINFRLDTILLALFRSSREVGLYGAAYKFVEFAQTITGSVGISIFPALNRFVATGDPRARTLAQRSFDVMLAASAPGVILMVAFADDILRWTAGPEFVAGAVALQILAAFLPLAFANHVLWRLLIAFHEDRVLVGLAASLVTLTIVLDSLLIPPYGFKAAALVTVGVEAFFVTGAAVVLQRRHRMAPSARYGLTIAVASAPAVAIVLWAPGADAAIAVAAVAAYLLAISLLPGTVRTIAAGLVARLRPVDPLGG